MSFAFVCDKEDRQSLDDPEHDTVGVMKFCPRCGQSTVAGYMCDTCGHEDIDPADQLAGHGEGKCEPKAMTDGLNAAAGAVA